MIEEILQDEEEHAADLSDLLYVVDPATGETRGQDPGTRPLGMQGAERSGDSGRRAAVSGRARNLEHEPEDALEALEQMERGPKQPRGGEERGDRERIADMPPSRTRRQPVGPEMTRTGERGEMIPARQGKSEFAGRGEAVPPAHEPGTSGHPTRPRPQQTEEAEVDENVEAGVHRGSTRAVRVTKPNRKKRVA
jgi:hypothetical protein